MRTAATKTMRKRRKSPPKKRPRKRRRRMSHLQVSSPKMIVFLDLIVAVLVIVRALQFVVL